MRPLLGLLLLSTLSLPAFAEGPPKADAPSQHHARMTWEQHFVQANLAHDGHLTLEEAKGGYADVARHFDDVDAGHKGYVTEDDIRAWRVRRRAAHRVTKPAEDKPRQGAAVQSVDPDFRTLRVSSKPIVPASTGSPASRQ
jgi:hypothetical protein